MTNSVSLYGKTLLSWSTLMLMIPVGVIWLITTHSGRNWLNGQMDQPKVTTILPGITLEDSRRLASGPIVTSIRTNSEASRQGVMVGDAIIAIDGNRVKTLDQLRNYLQKDNDGEVDLRLAHGPKTRDVPLGVKGA